MNTTEAILLCSGHTLEEDYHALDKSLTTMAINTSVWRIIPGYQFYYMSLDFPAFLKPRIPLNAIIVYRHGQDIGHLHHSIRHLVKHEKKLTLDDWPALINHGYTLFTAIHFLVCCGFKHIHGCGVNLCLSPDEKFYIHSDVQGGPTDVFLRIKEIWNGGFSDNLRELGVTFTSRALHT